MKELAEEMNVLVTTPFESVRVMGTIEFRCECNRTWSSCYYNWYERCSASCTNYPVTDPKGKDFLLRVNGGPLGNWWTG